MINWVYYMITILFWIICVAYAITTHIHLSGINKRLEEINKILKGGGV